MTELDTRATFAAMLEEAASCDTGCLVVTDATGDRSGRIYLRDGDVYSVRVQGFLPRLGQRLRTGGMIDDDGLRTLLQQCGGDPYALDAGEKAVAADMVDVEVLHALHRELLLSSIGAMSTWERPRSKLRRWVQTSRLTIPPVSVPAVLRALDRRHERWEVLWAGVAAGAPVGSVYPRRRVAGLAQGEGASFEAEAVMAAADGTRSLDEVAGECGLTRFETGHVLAPLVAAGLVEVGRERARGLDDEQPVPGGAADHGHPLPVSPEGHLHSGGSTPDGAPDGAADGARPRRLPTESATAADRAQGPHPSEVADDEVEDAVLDHEWTSTEIDDEPAQVRTSTGPLVIDHTDDDEAQGPRLAPDVIAANEHVDELAEPSDLEDDLPAWGDPVDCLPDGIYLQPVAIDMPEVVFEALADGVTNRTPPPSDVDPACEDPGAEDAVAEDAGADEPGADERGAEELGADEPGGDEPGAEEPVPGQPAHEDSPPGEEPAAEESTPAEPVDRGELQDAAEAPPAARTEVPLLSEVATAVLASPLSLDADGGLRIPVPMPAFDPTHTERPEASAPSQQDEVASPPVSASSADPLRAPDQAGTLGTDALTLAVSVPVPEPAAAAGVVDGEAGSSAADEAERIAADEAVRVQAEEDAEERTARQAALQRARTALDAAQSEAERSQAACEELWTTRVRVEATVSRLAEAVRASDDELARLEAEARTSADLAEQVATAEEAARADLAEAEAAVAQAAAALQAAREAQEAAVSRLTATGASRADLDERASAAIADHRNAAERSVRLKAEERLARDGAAVSVRAHAAAEALAAAARESVAEAALRLERARSRLTELD